MTEQRDYGENLINDPRLGMRVKALGESRKFKRDVFGSIKAIRRFADGQELWSVLCDDFIIVDAHSDFFELDNQQQQSITAVYEQRALNAFVDWYRQAQPTIKDASWQAAIIARDTAGEIPAVQVCFLLQEHPEWIHEKPREQTGSGSVSSPVGWIVCTLLAQHLEQVIQAKGFQAVMRKEQEQ